MTRKTGKNTYSHLMESDYDFFPGSLLLMTNLVQRNLQIFITVKIKTNKNNNY